MIAVWLVAGVAGCAWSLPYKPEQCQYQQAVTASEQQQEKPNILKQLHAFKVSVVCWLSSISTQGWTVFAAVSTGIATLLLVGVTGWLAWIANQQSITVQGQTRAYVFIRGGRIQLNANGTAVIGAAEVENFGQTPGYDFETWTGIRLGGQEDDPFDEFGEPAQRSIIGPSADLGVPSVWLPISPGQRTAINAGQLVVFVWGYARYTDTFGRRWEFVFRSRNAREQEHNLVNSNTGQIMGVGWGLMPHPRGYSETQQ